MESFDGVIESQLISERLFSYVWQFNTRGQRTLYRSPDFKPVWHELFYCHFEAFYNNVSFKFLFSGSNKLASKMNWTAKLSGFGNLYCVIPEFSSTLSIKSSDLSFCTFEFPLDQKSYIRSHFYILSLKIELLEEQIPATSLPSSLSKKSNDHSLLIDNQNKIVQDLKFLYTSESMCDLKFNIGEEELRAHKLILCARSPVFMKMMEHDCLESTSNCITITDCSAESFKKFLKFIYTGEMEDTTMDTVIPLYALGDKYDALDLRETCSSILQMKFHSESVDDVADVVCDILRLAECHGDSKLKALSVDFINKQFPLVSKKKAWKDLMKSDFELTSEVLAVVVATCQKVQS